MELNVNNETHQLKAVLLGIADSFGGTPELGDCYDPKSKEHVLNGTFPQINDITDELKEFQAVLEKYSIQIYRPSNIASLNQIFSRDIAFVISNKIILSNIIKDREKEILAIDPLLNLIKKENIISLDKDSRIEGGDVILFNKFIFIGYSEEEDFIKYKVARTNKSGVERIKSLFPEKEVKSFELLKSDDNAKENALHLDCCFQPIGKNQAIIYEGGFKNKKDIKYLNQLFGSGNLIKINSQEMYDMNSNVFSISENVIISERSFLRLNKILRERGFTVEEISYCEISKMEGLLRCSTMPLIRK